MTAEVRVNTYINHSLVRGTGDTSNSFLNRTLPGKLLATLEGRLKTYKNWPNKNIEPEKLAAAGFFYSGRADVVQCFRCGIKGHNWLVNDKPMEDHKKWNTNCPFLRTNATEQNNAPQTPRIGRDYCGNFGDETSQYTVSEESQEYYRNLGQAILPFLEPSNPDQIIFENRLATFANWPKSLKQKPADLAAAGFYYIGIGDQTSCFSCGGGLKDWVEGDDPWEQHALWFPQCNYLLLKQKETPAIVKAVQEKHKNDSSSKQNDTEVVASCSSSNNSKESPSESDVKRERNSTEEHSPICKICYENQSNVLLLPCRHIIGCVECASKLKHCAVCREEIEDNFPVFYT